MLEKKQRSHENTKTRFFPIPKNHPVFVLDIGFHETPPLHTYGPAIRPYYLLHLVESGQGEIERAGQKTPVYSGQAFWIQPGEITTYRADPNDPWSYYWISFNGDFAKDLFAATTNVLVAPIRQSGIRAIQSALESKENDPVYALNTLFSVLNAVKTEVCIDERDAMDYALQLLENSYFKPFSISELAAEFGYSRTRFTTLFTQKTGVSPYLYLTKIRIEKAKELLRYSQATVEETAYSVGFSSVVRFCDLFKKYIGVTPSEYRRSL